MDHFKDSASAVLDLLQLSAATMIALLPRLVCVTYFVYYIIFCTFYILVLYIFYYQFYFILFYIFVILFFKTKCQ